MHGQLRDTDDPTLAKRIDRIRRQTQRLSRLVDTLLDVSRVSVGQFALQREECDLGELTSDAVERFGDEARRAGCRLLLSIRSTATGEWDRLRLEQAVGNLLSNAIRYGAEAPIEVLVESDGTEARVTVRDHGPGIPGPEQARIFERFERAATSRGFGGLGLGLYITRSIAEAHGGRISVESAPGAGAAFTLALPLL